MNEKEEKGHQRARETGKWEEREYNRILEQWLSNEEDQSSVPSTTHMETQYLLVQVKGGELPGQALKDSCRHAVHKHTHP